MNSEQGKVTNVHYARIKKQRFIGIIAFIVIIIGFGAWKMFFGEQEKLIYLEFSDKVFSISAPNGDLHTINYSDIQSLVLRYDPDYGQKIEGECNGLVCYGTWENTEWGRYQLNVYVKPTCCVVIQTSDAVFVLSIEDTLTTESLYRGLLEMIG